MDNFEKLMLAIFSCCAGTYATEAYHRILAEKAVDTAWCLIFAFLCIIGAYLWSRQ